MIYLIGFFVCVVLFWQIAVLSGRVRVLEERLFANNNKEPLASRPTPADAAGTASQPGVTGVEVAHPELVAFIKEQWQRGVDETSIVSALRARGWQSGMVSEAVAAAGLSTTFRPATMAVSSGRSGIDAFFAWCREDWLLKIGAGLIIIAFGWFVTYAFMNNWIGLYGRVMCGLLAGAAFLAIGGWRIRTHPHQGGVFLVVGSTVVLVTVFAARQYDIFEPTSALVMMFLSTAVLAVMSVKHKRPALAHASLVLASIAPFLTNPPEASAIGLFTYLMVVTIGGIGVVIATGGRSLLVTSLVITTIYSLPFLFDGADGDGPVLLVYAFAFAAIYFLMQVAALLRKPTLRTADVIMAPGVGLFVVVWILAMVPEVWQSLFLSAWALVFAVGSFVIARRLELPVLMYLYSGVALAFLATATAAELSGYALTVAFTFEVAAVVLGSWWLWGDTRVVRVVAGLFVVPIGLALPAFDPYHWQGDGLPLNELTVLCGLSGVLILTGLYFLLISQRNGEEAAKSLGGVLSIVGSLFVYALLWLVLHVFFVDDTAVTLALAIYTLIGIGAYLSGHRSGVEALRWYGGILIMAVVARLLLIDVWEMAIAGRIITFGVVGALLMSTAFMAKQKKL